MVSQLGINCTPIRTPNLSFGSKKKDNNLIIKEEYLPQERKTSAKNCAQQAWDGLVSPVRELISHPLVLTSAIGISMAANKLLGKYKAIVGLASIATTSAFAVGNAVKGAYSFITAKNATEREESCYDIGQGVSFGILASLPAKKVAALNGIEVTETMKPWQALAACIKHIPTRAKEIYTSVKEGEKLGEALGAVYGTGATGAAEACSSHHFDIPDAPNFDKDSSSRTKKFMNTMAEKGPRPVKSSFALVDFLRNDETGGLIITAKATGMDGHLNTALKYADSYKSAKEAMYDDVDLDLDEDDQMKEAV